ncbi:23S rRNA (uracil1939-C5)-methyltransferase [Tangfeifania diversioriginum]|uniref:23S rRNA (Uracil1939-C5)-methyltransferase n=1 Tax=Tangfeifania diversioriginum TaxID=1168035 RepID=A0A1M6LYS6_9BACT|nr:23S rRNA (uracil(1939)-C(5))-methyltransferase RlmD [Tangfeifania diversioriginum]SHJ76325.1 23S rRNA (uracil1939-C5)-methyltransferase [Tangfeifania diversioriginum]
MGRNRKKPYYEKIQIEDIGSEGKALARVGELIVFTKLAIPGDVVDLQVTKKRKKYQEAFVAKIHEYSKDRVEAFCEHFGTCGGCKWQFLPYQKQLAYKQKQVEDQLKRIGKVSLPEVSPILGSEKNTFYRNKLEFTFSNKKWLTAEEIESGKDFSNSDSLGFHAPGMFDKVINIEKCWLQPEPSNKIRNFIYNYAIENNLDFFDIREKKGFLRTLIIRTSSTGETMVILSLFHEDENKRIKLLEALKDEFPEITSLMYVINEKGNDTITDQEIELFHGRDHIFEEMEGLEFKIGPKSFYQTNSEQAYRLYKVARDFADLKGSETVYDLYTGTGTIANFIARNAKKVVGIEYVPEAINDAKINAEINKIDNTHFFAGDIKEVMRNAFIKQLGHPDVVITDPPRAGMHKDVVATLTAIKPDKIVYVSCNPATQARDVSLLSEFYKVSKVQPVDMFPHTHHVENVVLLEKIII